VSVPSTSRTTRSGQSQLRREPLDDSRSSVGCEGSPAIAAATRRWASASCSSPNSAGAGEPATVRHLGEVSTSERGGGRPAGAARQTGPASFPQSADAPRLEAAGVPARLSRRAGRSVRPIARHRGPSDPLPHAAHRRGLEIAPCCGCCNVGIPTNVLTAGQRVEDASVDRRGRSSCRRECAEGVPRAYCWAHLEQVPTTSKCARIRCSSDTGRKRPLCGCVRLPITDVRAEAVRRDGRSDPMVSRAWVLGFAVALARIKLVLEWARNLRVSATAKGFTERHAQERVLVTIGAGPPDWGES
jgi:hypothetical protein